MNKMLTAKHRKALETRSVAASSLPVTSWSKLADGVNEGVSFWYLGAAFLCIFIKTDEQGGLFGVNYT